MPAERLRVSITDSYEAPVEHFRGDAHFRSQETKCMAQGDERCEFLAERHG